MFQELLRPPVWHHMGQDLRYCVRTLARKPLFATAIVLTMALGIGANTATYSVVSLSSFGCSDSTSPAEPGGGGYGYY